MRRNENAEIASLEGSKRPTIYICIEQKNREYDEKLLLAAELTLKGYRCYIGTHAAIWGLLRVKNEQSGIYFDKGTQLPIIMNWIKTKCKYFVVMDVELGPVIRNVDLMFSPFNDFPAISRLYPGSDEIIDRFLCIGPRIFEGARAAFPKNVSVAVMTGWPRMDIWENIGSELYKREIASIRNKHGKFLLFASDFTFITDPGIYGSREEELSHFGWNLKTNFDFFMKTVEILKVWDENPNVPAVILRPHISEDPRVWKKALGNTTKTHVIHSGDITQWILASEGLIHRGSTTAVQAVLANKPTYFLAESTNFDGNEITHQISNFTVGKEFPPVPQFNLPINLETRSQQLQILEKVLFRTARSSTQEVIDVLQNLIDTPTLSHSRMKLIFDQINIRSFRRLVGLLRHELRWKFKLTTAPSQLHFTPFGLGPFEVKRMLNLNEKYNEIRVRRMTINLWEFTL